MNVEAPRVSAIDLLQWLTDRKRRKLERRDVDVRRRIELIQDFAMPDLSTSVNLTPDHNYIFATGHPFFFSHRSRRRVCGSVGFP